MQVKEVMTGSVECVAPDATIASAAARMRDLDVGALPICNNDRLEGMVTDRDIAIRAVADGRDPKSTTVRDVMTPNLVYAFDDQDVEEAADLMREHQIRRLPVLNRDKRLVGIVSLGDLAVETDEELVGSTLEAVSEPAQPHR